MTGIGIKPKTVHTTAFTRANICLVLLIITVACNSPVPSTISPPSSPASTEDLGSLSPDAVSTLSSLEKLDDYPFYVMHYTGDYTYPLTGSNLPESRPFSCSLFAALANAETMLYGRNFDWQFSPSLLLFTDPSDGYASVSMVDLTFIGVNPAVAAELDDLPLLERTDLLAAPSMPFDGMNEYGLTIAMAAVPNEFVDDAINDPSRPSIGSIGIIRQILDHARNVDEGLAIFEQYNIEFTGGPPIHYLLADPSGKAVLVEFYQGQMEQLPNQSPWHLATNHLRCIAEGDGGCWRYRTISERLNSTNGLLDLQSAMQLLSDVRQNSTQWSSIYNMSTGEINVVIAQQYNTIYPFQLDLIRP
jgi:hypothetical protein